MSISVYTLENRIQWDLIIKSFHEYDIYYLSGYVNTFKIHGDGEPLLIFYKAENIKAINVVMKRDISDDKLFAGLINKNTLFDFITPYGYGGWLIEGEGNLISLFSQYEAWCQENNIVSEFIRFHPILRNQHNCTSSYEIIHLGNTIAMELGSPEIICENLTSKNRNVIRKAQKSGIVIKNGLSSELITIFKDLYEKTMDRDHAELYYYFGQSFYDSILRDLDTEAQVFYASLNNKVIAAAIVLAANGRLNYHLSGSNKEYQTLAPTNLLLYKVALWGYLNGYQTLHLGGGVGSSEDSLFAFKKAFYRGEPCKYYIGKKVYINDAYKNLVLLRDSIPKCNFFPTYRAK